MAIKKTKEDKAKKSAKGAKEKPAKGKKAKAVSEEEKPKRKKKAKVVSEEDTPKAKKGKKTKAESDSESLAFNAYADLDSMLDDIEKETGMSGGGLGKRVTTSTGLLTLDLILGGGLTSGSWNTFYGGEQSSKSTLSMTQLAHAAVTREIPVLMYFDFEGSYDAQYMLSLARVQGFKGDITDLFGVQDDEGFYVKKPIIRKYSADVAEKFFNMVYKLEKNLPDKLYKKGLWWHVYEGTKENKAKYGSLANPKYLKKTGNLWIEAPNDQPQALIVVDSYPAMLPANMDDDNGKAGIGAQARMFSEQLKRVKGRMKSKAVTILGINQLRQKPMVMFGSPEYEPGGEALKFFSDMRLKMVSRAVPPGEPRKKNSSNFAEEDSVEYKGLKDTYRYVHIRATKNKLSAGSDMEGWVRIWVRDGAGNAKGYDPVFDSYEFMKSLGILSGSRNRIKIDFDLMKVKGLKGSHSVSWNDFKKLIVGDKAQKDKVLASLKYDGKRFNIRDKLFAMIRSGEAQKMYFEAVKSKATENSDGSDED